MFAAEIQEFTMSLDSLRDYNSYIEPLVLENIKNKFDKEYREMNCLEVTFKKLNELPKDASDEEIAAAIEDVNVFFKEKIEVNFEEEDQSWSITTCEDDAERFNDAAINMENLRRQLELMYKSTLINIVSNVECYFGDILHKYFALFKGEVVGKLIESKDKIYTINELEEFDSIEDARNFIVDKKIENLIRSSFKEWINFLKDKMKLSMGYMKDDMNSLEEIFQRRNIFIHNKGVINRIYISNVEEKSRYSNVIGEKIIIEKGYLENTINLLEKNFTLIAFEIWKSREKSDECRTIFLRKLAQKYMKQERWDLLKSTTTFIINDRSTTKAVSTRAQINLWLAEKRLGKLNKEEIEKCDLSASSLEYRICQAALLDDDETTLKLLELALDTNQIDNVALFQWPVFMEFRTTDSFLHLIEERNITEPIVKNLIYPQIEDDRENCTCEEELD